MEIWLDAQISPHIANWIRKEFSINCFALRDLSLRDASDSVIFKAAQKKTNITLITKDEDFCNLLRVLGPPPKIIWLTIGNCPNDTMKKILQKELPVALSFLQENDMVEISG